MSKLPPITGNDDLDFYLQDIQSDLDNITLTDTETVKVNEDGVVSVGDTILGYTKRYLHVAYASDENGTGFTRDPANLGSAAQLWQGRRNDNSASAITNAGSYAWRRIDTSTYAPNTVKPAYTITNLSDVLWSFTNAVPSGYLTTLDGLIDLHSANIDAKQRIDTAYAQQIRAKEVQEITTSGDKASGAGDVTEKIILDVPENFYGREAYTNNQVLGTLTFDGTPLSFIGSNTYQVGWATDTITPDAAAQALPFEYSLVPLTSSGSTGYALRVKPKDTLSDWKGVTVDIRITLSSPLTNTLSMSSRTGVNGGGASYILPTNQSTIDLSVISGIQVASFSNTIRPNQPDGAYMMFQKRNTTDPDNSLSITKIELLSTADIREAKITSLDFDSQNTVFNNLQIITELSLANKNAEQALSTISDAIVSKYPTTSVSAISTTTDEYFAFYGYQHYHDTPSGTNTNRDFSSVSFIVRNATGSTLSTGYNFVSSDKKNKVSITSYDDLVGKYLVLVLGTSYREELQSISGNQTIYFTDDDENIIASANIRVGAKEVDARPADATYTQTNLYNMYFPIEEVVSTSGDFTTLFGNNASTDMRRPKLDIKRIIVDTNTNTNLSPTISLWLASNNPGVLLRSIDGAQGAQSVVTISDTQNTQIVQTTALSQESIDDLSTRSAVTWNNSTADDPDGTLVWDSTNKKYVWTAKDYGPVSGTITASINHGTGGSGNIVYNNTTVTTEGVNELRNYVYPSGKISEGTYTAANVQDIHNFRADKIVTYTTSEPAASTTPSDYNFLRIRGDDGEAGTQGAAGENALQVTLSTLDGTVFKNSTGSKTLKVNVSSGGRLYDDNTHNQMGYAWNYKNIPICVDSGRHVLNSTTGEPLQATQNADGSYSCPVGQLANSSGSIGTALREIIVGAEDVSNLAQLNCDVSNIPD